MRVLLLLFAYHRWFLAMFTSFIITSLLLQYTIIYRSACNNVRFIFDPRRIKDRTLSSGNRSHHIMRYYYILLLLYYATLAALWKILTVFISFLWLASVAKM